MQRHANLLAAAVVLVLGFLFFCCTRQALAREASATKAHRLSSSEDEDSRRHLSSVTGVSSSASGIMRLTSAIQAPVSASAEDLEMRRHNIAAAVDGLSDAEVQSVLALSATMGPQATIGPQATLATIGEGPQIEGHTPPTQAQRSLYGEANGATATSVILEMAAAMHGDKHALDGKPSVYDQAARQWHGLSAQGGVEASDDDEEEDKAEDDDDDDSDERGSLILSVVGV